MDAKNKVCPRDINELAKFIVDTATCEKIADEIIEDQANNKNPAAVALGRLGGKKGGQARALKLTPEQRKEISKKAAEARWKKGKS